MADITSKIVAHKVNTTNSYQTIILKNIKHDIINPISAMIGYSELLLDLLDRTKKVALKKDIQSIYQSSKSLLSMLQDVFSNKSISDHDNIVTVILNEEFHFSLRTPLSSIIGLSEFIIEDSLPISDSNMEDIIDSVSKINQAGKGLLRLIKNLSKYSDLSNSDLIERYYTDLYLKESTIRDFEFNIQVKIPVKTGTIMIVDDEPENLDLIDKIIQQSNHKTFTAESGEVALNILKSESANIDLILLDLIMPEINGIELLQKLKNDANTYHIPVILLSALDEINTIVECISLGADDFLMKPINKVLLNARMNNALEKKYFHDKEIKYQDRIKKEQKKSESLLLNILPGSIAERLKNGETLIADDIDSATVLFADLTGFTELSSSIKAKDIVMLLNNVFSTFDELLVKYSLEKIKTIGDNYMLAGGLPEPSNNHAESVAEMALDMLNILPKINKQTQNEMQIRIGINSGPVSAGVIGKKKFIYDLWGDTVNVASRMEAYGKESHIHINEATYELLNDMYQFKKRELLNIPGKGKMQTYFLTGRKLEESTI